MSPKCKVTDAFSGRGGAKPERDERTRSDCDRGDDDDDHVDDVGSGCDLRAVCLVRAMTTDVCDGVVVVGDDCCCRWMWMLSGWGERRRRQRKKDIGAGATSQSLASTLRFPALVTVDLAASS